MGGAYFDLESPEQRNAIDAQWPSLVTGRKLVILDEAQAFPEIFPRLRGAIDEDRKRKGRFLLLGSVSPSLMRQVSESLAGRLSHLSLSPFDLTELPRRAPDHLWLYGGFPDGGILTPDAYPLWERDYLQSLTQRDLPNWGLTASPALTQRLLQMLAALHAQAWNASQVGANLGLSYHTVNSYVDYLEGSFLVRRLQPYHVNLSKRLVKSPKLYWRDSGLLHAVLGASNLEHLLTRPWVGASWEGFVIEQVLSALSHTDMACQPYFFRTHDQHEIDLLLDFGDRLWAIEIKMTSSPTLEMSRRLDAAADLIKADRRILICRTAKPFATEKRTVCNLRWFLGHLIQQRGESQ
jgi:predicted AAA+ superfamily ATPase